MRKLFGKIVGANLLVLSFFEGCVRPSFLGGHIGLLLFCFFSFSAHAVSGNVDSKYFEKQKLYTEELYVLKDYLEFSVFDMSQMKLIDDSDISKGQETIVLKEGQTPQTENTSEILNSKEEVTSFLKEIPKSFFRSLQSHIVKQKVPVTVYASQAPEYANPLKLYIKIKRIHLASAKQDQNGQWVQPIFLHIYGQIKDKKSGKILMRYYDSQSSEFLLGKDQVKSTFEFLADNLMRDLALFLQTKY